MFFCYKTVLKRRIRIRRPLFAIVIGGIMQNLMMEIDIQAFMTATWYGKVFRFVAFL